MDLTLEFVSRIKHACRNGYYQEVQRVADEALHRFPNENIFNFYKGIGLFMLRKNNDAIRILEPLQRERPLTLGSCVASIAAHKACVQIDRETVASLEANVKDRKKTASQEELCYAGIFFSLTEQPEKAKDYLDRASKQTGSGSHEILCARGWLEIQLKEKGTKPASDYFEAVLKENRRHLDALLGLANYYELNSRFEVAVEKLNQALATLPNWIPALVEKMKVVLASLDWGQAQDIANRILEFEDNLEARRLKILHVLCREGNLELVVPMLEEFYTICRKLEPHNAKYFIENARVFSQLASFSPPIVSEAVKFAKFAAELEIDNAEYITDVGKLYLLLNDVKEAHQEFRMATDMDKTSMPALYGLISCQLVEGDLDHAYQQLEFLRELASFIDKPPELLYLSAVVAKERNQSPEIVIKFLNDAVEAHFANMKGLSFNLKYLKLINPDLVLKIVKEYLQFAPQEPVGPGIQIPLSVKQAAVILETVMKVCPSHRDALFINAQVQYLSGDSRSAIGTLDHLTKIDSSLLDVHLLLAQIHLSQEEYDQASFALENGLSSNFKIREHPKYQLLLGKVQRHKGQGKEAIKTLNVALNIVKSNKLSGLGDFSSNTQTTVKFGQADKMALYMELIAIHRQLGNLEEANNLMQEALIEFKGTNMEGRLGLTQAEEMIDKGELDKAISLLRTVQPEQSHFIDSRRLMAEIYMNYRPNNELYISCFTEIVNSNPIPVNLIMLADAYMSIQEPDKAVEIYELALAKNPRDPVLSSKMGQALVLTHQYNKAINYYKEAVKNDDTFSLRFDLSTLHMKLKQWDKAEKTIQQALGDIKDNSLSSMMMEVKFLIILAKVQQGSGNSSLAQQSLVRAKDSENRVLKRVSFEQPSNAEEQKKQFCTICKLLGDVAEKMSEIDFAIRSLKDAIEICPDDWQCLIVLAKLHMKAGNHTPCQQTCQQLLRLKKDCVEASLMLGELFFRKADFQSSSFHFQQFLDRNPTNWKSLMWFIECGRRMGNLSEAESYVKAASNIADPNDPGFGYCQGIFEWYSGNSNAALKMLNKARKDPVYGSKALIAMIDIYINPTGNVLGGDALESSGSGDTLANGSGGKADFRDVTLNTAETLINELNAKTQDEKFRRHILDCFVLIASKNKAKVEKATQELSGLLTTEAGKESVMLIYALSTGYMFAKQVPKARNQLKRVTKQTWKAEDAEYLERCWLLLADIYIQSSKFDLATELIKKVLQYNKSCFKANEYFGFIMEKEQSYADAAANYEAAWKLTNCSNPAMGYKLAFNYLKAKRYTDAIDVCHIVIGKFPTYPKIKKEILDKARANLRP